MIFGLKVKTNLGLTFNIELAEDKSKMADRGRIGSLITLTDLKKNTQLQANNNKVIYIYNLE